MMEELTKTSRILSVYHLFLNCQEVSFQELKQQFEVSEKTSLRDIRLLERAGVLETRYDRNAKAFYPVSLELRPMAAEENQTRRKYLDACPAGRRHVLIYYRRKGNGPCPRTSIFMDLWWNRGVDIWDLGEQ